MDKISRSSYGFWHCLVFLVTSVTLLVLTWPKKFIHCKLILHNLGCILTDDIYANIFCTMIERREKNSLRSRRKRGRRRGARMREKNGVVGARDKGMPATKTPIF